MEQTAIVHIAICFYLCTCQLVTPNHKRPSCPCHDNIQSRADLRTAIRVHENLENTKKIIRIDFSHSITRR